MRKDQRPYPVKRWMTRLSDRYAERFLHPHFDALGPEPDFRNPRCIEVMGPNIRVGRNFHAMATKDRWVRLNVWPESGGSITIGDYVALSPGVRITGALSITIGDACSLAQNVFVTDSDWHDFYHRIYPGPMAPVVLEENVWICDGVTICKGVTIGRNSIVGAAAVVTANVAANAIVAGNPARQIAELDPTKPMTTRRDLFQQTPSFSEIEDRFDRKYLSGNTFGSWLRSLLRPDRTM